MLFHLLCVPTEGTGRYLEFINTAWARGSMSVPESRIRGVMTPPPRSGSVTSWIRIRGPRSLCTSGTRTQSSPDRSAFPPDRRLFLVPGRLSREPLGVLGRMSLATAPTYLFTLCFL